MYRPNSRITNSARNPMPATLDPARRKMGRRLLTLSLLLPTLCLPLFTLRAANATQTKEPPITPDPPQKSAPGKSSDTRDAKKPSKETPIQWGQKVRGIALGARLAHDSSTFKVGDTLNFQTFAHNYTGKALSLDVGNYWKVNYKIQIQTQDGKPVYMERDSRNKAMLVAGYLEEHLIKDSDQEISKAILKVASPTAPQKPDQPAYEQDEPLVESVPLKPGHYRVRILSWHLFGREDPQPASGWIPIEIAP